MKILLLGYGKMGKTIEKLALANGHEIVGRIELNNHTDLRTYTGKNTDVAIEFSEPDAAYSNIQYCLKNKIKVVSGTTGWLDRKPEIDRLCQEMEGTFFYASNFSVGVNIFFQLNRLLVGMMKGFEEYAVGMEEIHHTEKKDEPSGTAITLAEGILTAYEQLKGWSLDEEAGKLNIHSKREGKVPGTHIITYSSAVDDIEIKHTAHSREGFAKGALQVAEWIQDKKGILDMKDFLKI